MTARLLAPLLALILAFPAVAALADDPAPSLADGFNGLAWGTPKTACKEFFRLKSKGKAAYYVNTRESYFVKGLPSPRVLYGFFEDRLFAVFLALPDPALHDHYLAELTARYGPPEASREDGSEILRWKDGEVKIKLKRKPDSGEMKLGYYYVPLSAKVNLDEVGETFEDIERRKTYDLYPIETWRHDDM